MATIIDCLFHDSVAEYQLCHKLKKVMMPEDRACEFCPHYISTEGKTGEEIFKEVADRCVDPPRIVSDSNGQYYIPLGVRNSEKSHE